MRQLKRAGCLATLSSLILGSISTEAQDSPLGAPLPASPLVAQPRAIYSAYQVFDSGDFDLGQKQLSFYAAGQENEYLIWTDDFSGITELEQEWEVADDLTRLDLASPFRYAGRENIGLRIHQAGYITFNDSEPAGEVDCLNVSSFHDNNYIVALCAVDYVTLIRYADLDDRLIVQWALPWGQCLATASTPPATVAVPAGGPGHLGSYMLIAQAELSWDGTIRLAWTAGTPCPTSVGIGRTNSQPQQLQFASLAHQLRPAPLDCTKFSVEGAVAAYPCNVRKAAILAAPLQPVVLFSGGQQLEQQAVTIANVAGQAASETGRQPLQPSMAPASPAGLSRTSRGLRQLPSGYGAPGGGLGLLQDIEERVAASLRSLAPTLAAEILGLNAPATPQNSSNSSSQVPSGSPTSPASLPPAQLAPLQPLPVLPGTAATATPGPGDQELSPVTTGRKLQQEPQGDPPVAAPRIAPAVAPLSVEAASGVVTAVGIRETPPAAPSRAEVPFLPAAGCGQPRQPGPCDAFSTRWHFDAASGTCTDFVFGGCLGNLNNFATRADCERACVGGPLVSGDAGDPSGQAAIPGPDELVFLASALTTKSWLTLDATSGVLPAGAVAALHLTFNATGRMPGVYSQTLTISSNDPEAMQTRLQVQMLLFCERLAGSAAALPPALLFTSLTGTPPDWAEAANLTAATWHAYFELQVIAESPILALAADNLGVDAGGEAGSIASISELGTELGYGPLCSAWRVRGVAPLPEDYAESVEGVLLEISLSGLQTVAGEAVPPAATNKTLFNSLPQCTLYAQGMTFGGDFGLVVDSNASAARAVLVCTTPLYNLCESCILPLHEASQGGPEVSFLGQVPAKQAQYDIEVSWNPGEFYGAVNLTVACNATDDLGRPLAAVQPLHFTVVKRSQLLPPSELAIPPRQPMSPPGINPYGTGPRPRSNETAVPTNLVLAPGPAAAEG